MKKLLFIAMLSICSTFAYAQEDGSTMEQPERTPLETPWEQDRIGDFTDPISYVHQNQGNVMYYTTVWRVLDLREKRNHPLYFPTSTRGSWRSMAQVIFDAIDRTNPDRSNTLKVYDDEFCVKEKSPMEIESSMVEYSTTDIIDPETQEVIGTQDMIEEFSASNIMYYYVKEVWFFDNKRSATEVRILQIQPIIEYVKELNTGYDDTGDDMEDVEAEKSRRRVGYIAWDELRPYLAEQEMFNPKNSASRISLDDGITWKRLFSSFVIGEGNTYSDREVQTYIKNARDQRLESERIIDKLRTFESDLWQF